MLEKLVTDRTGRKGDRDLLVVAGLLALAGEEDVETFVQRVATLPDEYRHTVVSNLTVLSLLEPADGMPDPVAERGKVALLLRRLRGAP